MHCRASPRNKAITKPAYYEAYYAAPRDMLRFQIAYSFVCRFSYSYLLQSGQWCQVPASEMIGERFSILSIDAHNCTKEDVTTVKSSFTSTIQQHSSLNALGGW